MSLSLYARLVKVDEATRRVTGVIASETLDRSREMFDYASSKPNFEKWSGDISEATEGKSLGNVRAMHGKVAAGRLTEIAFNDAEKMITVEADIVDDAEWNKLSKGLYTGFSIGGRYVRKWDDEQGVKRYEAEPNEVSLVDVPCIKNATFTMCKADGATVEEAFDASVATEAAPDAAPAAVDSGATQAAEGAEGAKTAPEATAASTQPVATDPAEGELRVQGADVEKFVGGAWLTIAKLAVADPVDKLEKSAYAISQLASLADGVLDFISYRSYSTWDGTGTNVGNIPDSLKAAATALYDGLIAIVSEDAEAAKSMIAAKLAEAPEGEELAKRAVLVEGVEHVEALAKALGVEPAGLVDTLTKVAAENATLRAEHVELRKRFDALPVADKGALRVVEKGTVLDELGDKDDATKGTTALGGDADPTAVTKAAFADALSRPVMVTHESMRKG